MRENSERVTHVSAVFYNDYHEAAKLCRLVNGLFTIGDEKLMARCICTGREYRLEKGSVLNNYDDLAKVDNRSIQKIMREFQSIFDKYEGGTEKQNEADSQNKHQGEKYIASALRDLDKESRERIIENLSYRVADNVIRLIDADEKSEAPLLRWNTKQARKKIVNAIIAVEEQFKRGKFPKGVEFLKD
jgi:hypothetical protein